MGHVVLLGDSVFDNGAYVGRGEPDVARQLHDRLPAGWGATLAAVDGAVTGDVPRQLGRVPPGATHLVVSVGGNDALRRQDVLGASARSVADALLALGEVRDGFARGYRACWTRCSPAGCRPRSARSTTRASRRDSAWRRQGWLCSTT